VGVASFSALLADRKGFLFCGSGLLREFRAKGRVGQKSLEVQYLH